jgi:hypothetical protein
VDEKPVYLSDLALAQELVLVQQHFQRLLVVDSHRHDVELATQSKLAPRLQLLGTPVATYVLDFLRQIAVHDSAEDAELGVQLLAAPAA